MAKPRNGNTGGIIIPEIAIDGGSGADVSDSAATDSAGNFVIDPAAFTAGSSGSDGSSSGDATGEPKRRGRKPGSAGTRKSQKGALDISGVEMILLNVHNMLAGFTRTPEFQMDKEEANALATGISNVSRHYDVQASQKSLDWANLIMLCGAIYGPRIVALNIRRSDEKRKRKEQMDRANNPGMVFPFPGPTSEGA